MSKLKRRDIVESLGQPAKVVSVYQNKHGVQFVHLSNGERNIKSATLQLSKNQIIPEEDTMKAKSLTAQELEALTKQEINTALGGKYTETQLKNITKGILIEEYEAQFKPAKKTTKRKITWTSVAKSLFIEKPHSIEEVVKKIVDNHKDLITKAFLKKNDEINTKRLAYYLQNYLDNTRGGSFGKNVLTKKIDDKYQLVFNAYSINK